MGFFESRGTKEKKTAVVNAIAIMLADGHIDDKELEMLSTICKKNGINDRELQAIINNPGRIAFTRPATQQARAEQLMEMIMMMLADGKIVQTEMDVLISLGRGLGFQASAIRALVQVILDQVPQSGSPQKVNVDINAFLH